MRFFDKSLKLSNNLTIPSLTNNDQRTSLREAFITQLKGVALFSLNIN